MVYLTCAMLYLSSAASQEIQRLQRRHPSTSNICRIGVKAGGCAEFHYTLSFEQVCQPNDAVVQFIAGDLKLVVDVAHRPYLEGVTLDYAEDLMGGGFRFQNPNALKHCGCGHCFAIHAESGEAACQSPFFN